VNKKILIVEDDEAILELCSTIFGFEGYRVLCARDGEEALRIMGEEKPGIILLDIQIPKINGMELCRLVKLDPAMSHTKILMLTGMSQDFSLPKALEMGADAYITKPFSLPTIVEKVTELLKNN
jgi:two-component system alkaline phosphatase synthesis response regulator PhoP